MIVNQTDNSQKKKHRNVDHEIKIILSLLDDEFIIKNIDGMAVLVENLRAILSDYDDNEEFCSKEVFENNCHLILLKCLEPKINQGNKKLIEATLWCFSNISLAPKEYTQILIKNDFLKTLYSHLDITNHTTLNCIYWTINNILSENSECKEELHEIGYVDFLINNKKKLTTLSETEKTIAWFFSNFIQGEDPENEALIGSYFLLIETYKEYFFIKDKPECQYELFWALNFLFQKNFIQIEDKYKFIQELNIIEILFNSIKGNSDSLNSRPVLGILGKLSNANEDICKIFLNPFFKTNIIKMIDHSNFFNVVDGLWILSNLILTNTKYALFFYNDELIDSLRIKILDGNVALRIKNEIIFVFRSFFQNLDQKYKIELIFEKGLLISVLFSLQYIYKDFVTNCISFLREILEFAEEYYQNK